MAVVLALLPKISMIDRPLQKYYEVDKLLNQAILNSYFIPLLFLLILVSSYEKLSGI
jgi:hypothetical protein